MLEIPRATRLAIRHVTKRFAVGDEEIEALARVDLAIEAGEFVCLIGASGCGKSTLLRIIAGFEEPTTGEVQVDGTPITGAGRDRGMVFQDYALFPWMTVRQNIGFGPRQRHLARREVDMIATEFARLVGLERFAERYPSQLSGGMKQRVAIARVLANDASILLMDEPFGALDAQTRVLMQTELLNIWKRTPKTVIFVTHDVQEAVYLAERVVVMSARPGHIKAIVETKFGDRNPAIVRSKEFVEKTDEIWNLVREEAIKAQEKSQKTSQGPNTEPNQESSQDEK